MNNFVPNRYEHYNKRGFPTGKTVGKNFLKQNVKVVFITIRQQKSKAPKAPKL